MSTDCYAAAAAGWASGAARVYEPLATELVRRAPRPLRGRTVLDAGAGTGLGCDALAAVGARPVAVDLSLDMLRWRRRARPPAVVGDVTRLPLRDAAVDDVLAAFVLNHLRAPGAGLAELRRVTRPGGAVLAAVYATTSHSAARDLVDEVAAGYGFAAPAWYRELKSLAVPQLGSAPAMGSAARAAGLVVVAVEERVVDVGLHTAAELVDYRFGQAQYAGWVSGLCPARRAAVRAAAIARVEPIMQPYRPTVVFLVARVR